VTSVHIRDDPLVIPNIIHAQGDQNSVITQVANVGNFLLFNNRRIYRGQFMRKIKIFLASSNELKAEREKFEIEIYQ
jgi:hypothetical protein